MTQIIQSLDEVDPGYNVLFCDLWGCLHNGKAAFPDAVAALEKFRSGGGRVVLLTNAPRPWRSVRTQIDRLGASRECWDLIVTSGDAAQTAMADGFVGRKVYHVGPEKDLVFFEDENGKPFDVGLVPLDEAEGIVCTGLFDDRSETPEDYRATILYGVNKGLKLLCANPDVIVDVGETRIYCAGAIAAAYTEAGGQSYYFGKPHAPIYDLARRRLENEKGMDRDGTDIVCIGDGIFTDITGAMGESLDAIFVTGGLAAEETETTPTSGPDPKQLDRFLAEAKLSPKYAMGFLR
ncbi:TIGR01459 family HAD-type hydrolase [Amaricoccus tamworthensis]|uniref:TIGR01459 family HAD-type hydrolase n=1 Tax=Amaricoccus tamworthensis TaxID=57002 RepID=UPI003C7AC4D9